MNFDNIIVPETYSFDKEGRITVDERELIVPPELQVIGVMADNKTERVYFEFPRYFDEVNDLSTFNIYINYLNANGEPDLYHCDDVKIENDNIVFSWLTGAHLYKFKGVARFTVRAVHADGREWGTAISELRVLEGLNTSKAIYEKDYDFINQQFEELGKLSKQVSDGVLRLDEAKAYAENAKKDASVALESKVEATAEANRATQEANRAESKAKLVEIAMLSVPKLKAEGNPIVLDDAVEQKVSDVLPYIPQPVVFAKGSTVQNGVPTPENPIEFQNGKITEITSFGKNLINFPFGEKERKTITASSDGFYEKTNYFAHLEAGKTYTCSIKTDGVWGNATSEDFVKMYLLLDRGYSVTVDCITNPFTFRALKSGNYYLRLDVLKDLATHNFWNLQIEESPNKTEYVSYKGQTITFSQPIELAQNDSIGHEEDEWKIVRNRYQQKITKILSVTELSNVLRISAKLDKTVSGDIKKDCKCNRLPSDLSYSGDYNHAYVSNNSVGYLFIDKSEFGGNFSTENVTNYFSSKEYIIQYEVEPYFELLSKEDSNKLDNMIIQTGTTTIMTDTAITLSVNYIADTGRWVLNQIQKATAPQSQMVTQTQLNRTLATLPMETQAAMIENDLQNSLEEI